MSRSTLLIIALLIFAGAGVATAWLVHQPRVVLLTKSGDSQWIRVDRPLELQSRTEDSAACFLCRFHLDHSVPTAVIDVTALRRVHVQLDGQSIFDSGPDLEGWKTSHPVSTGSVSAGSHEFRCDVSNVDGPSLLRASCPELGISTNSHWLAGADGVNFKPAVLANQTWEPPIPQQLQPGPTGLIARPIAAGLIFTAACLLRRQRSMNSKIQTAARVRWLLLIGWAVMSLNNFQKLDIGCGFDARAHYKYIEFVAKNLSLPGPDQDWESFQSPLYYIASAIVYRALAIAGISLNSVQYLLRWLPLLSGAAILEISFRAARSVFPTRGDLQIIATVIGGLMPVNLYMAQTVSNEPMAAAVSGIMLLIIIRMLKQPAWAVESMPLLMAGLILGAATLTKINALLWAIPLGAAIVIALRSQKVNWIGSMRAAGIVTTGIIAVTGWWFVRNYRLAGRILYLESPYASHRWWQDPGYRTPENFYQFGHVFSRPIYNGMASVWDSLYGSLWGNGIVVGRVPWDMELMWFGLWLAIVPTIGIAIGIFRSIFEQQIAGQRRILRASTLAIGCFVAAILYVYLKLPIYSCAKASYLLGTVPCLGLVTAAGLEWPMRVRWLRAILGGFITCWAVTAYLTFWAP